MLVLELGIVKGYNLYLSGMLKSGTYSGKERYVPMYQMSIGTRSMQWRNQVPSQGTSMPTIYA
ncbi:hypothetical protein HKD37_15G042192 [Glycine soja]